ncbi:Hypothetical_protein [Hexamita inflata]|uniref:Hypothetical_protein n=1 Tax=Hexamita inflata TaxID=28002 RepID=A0AA86NN95_9EUKA|nr:Hypothetical protein HINF_LOCUS10243 [Hexamita inflata]
MTLHQFPSRARLSASSRRDRRRTERKVRANGAQAQAEARKAGGRRAKRAQSEGEQCKSKARRLQLGEQGSSSAKVRARAPDSRRNWRQEDPARSSGKQGQPSSSQKSRRKTLTAKAGGEKGPKQPRTPEPGKSSAQEGAFGASNQTLISLQNANQLVQPREVAHASSVEAEDSYLASSTQVGGGFLFCALFTVKAVTSPTRCQVAWPRRQQLSNQGSSEVLV